VSQLGELEKRIDEFQAVGDLVAVGYDTPESLQQTQADSGASFPLLADIEMTVTPLYDMQLRPDWPMGGMGDMPEMGYVVVSADGRIKLQRVDLYFGDNAGDILTTMKSQ
jgi:peroxiredoxin